MRALRKVEVGQIWFTKPRYKQIFRITSIIDGISYYQNFDSMGGSFAEVDNDGFSKDLNQDWHYIWAEDVKCNCNKLRATWPWLSHSARALRKDCDIHS